MKELGWEPTTTLEVGLGKTVEYFSGLSCCATMRSETMFK
jgi:dTDP-D-glucose 4,6-dehydratase